MYSKVMWRIPSFASYNGRFNSWPFIIDLLTYSNGDESSVGQVSLPISDGLLTIASTEMERKDGKLLTELHDGGNLSWIRPVTYSKQFSFPAIYPCSYGCEAEHYYNKPCTTSDWELIHSLLFMEEDVESTKWSALLKFIEHADMTNDIFLLALKVISLIIMTYRKLKRENAKENEQKVCTHIPYGSHFSLLLDAWKSILMEFHRRWWGYIALPCNVYVCNETSFRMLVRDLAFASVQLLKDYKESAPLFPLKIYGNLIEQEEAEKLTKPFMDASGDEYAVCCHDSGFFPLQNCMNCWKTCNTMKARICCYPIINLKEWKLKCSVKFLLLNDLEDKVNFSRREY